MMGRLSFWGYPPTKSVLSMKDNHFYLDYEYDTTKVIDCIMGRGWRDKPIITVFYYKA